MNIIEFKKGFVIRNENQILVYESKYHPIGSIDIIVFVNFDQNIQEKNGSFELKKAIKYFKTREDAEKWLQNFNAFVTEL